MSPIQRRFVEEYAKDCKGAAAARRAGYSPNGAKQKASELLKDPIIQAAIKQRLDGMAMSAEEAIKHTTDIARTRLNDFFIVEPALRRPTVKKPLTELITHLQETIRIQAEFFDRGGVPDADQDDFHKAQTARKSQILLLQIELEHHPDAFQNVVEESWQEEARLDLVALVRAQDEGRIKSISYTQFGIKVEMYDAQAALGKLLEVHGKLINRTDLTTGGQPIGLDERFYKELTDEQLDLLHQISRKIRAH